MTATFSCRCTGIQPWIRGYRCSGKYGQRANIITWSRFKMSMARTGSTIQADDCVSAHLRRYSLGATPISRLKTRLKEVSDSYPTAEAASENDVSFERIMAPALYIRHCVRYSRGVWPKTVLNFKAKAELDMRASRASDSTDQLLSRPECIASMALPICLSDMAANHPFGGAAELIGET